MINANPLTTQLLLLNHPLFIFTWIHKFIQFEILNLPTSPLFYFRDSIVLCLRIYDTLHSTDSDSYESFNNLYHTGPSYLSFPITVCNSSIILSINLESIFLVSAYSTTTESTYTLDKIICSLYLFSTILPYQPVAFYLFVV